MPKAIEVLFLFPEETFSDVGGGGVSQNPGGGVGGGNLIPPSLSKGLVPIAVVSWSILPPLLSGLRCGGPCLPLRDGVIQDQWHHRAMASTDL